MKNRENGKLRRQVEILKAQLNSKADTIKQQTIEKASQPDLRTAVKILKKGEDNNKSYALNINEIKKDLLKTLFFLIASVLMISTLAVSQNKWITLIKF
ncbi:MAG: hypothetical protein AAB443_00580 [Patescibacteria group bacterium]